MEQHYVCPKKAWKLLKAAKSIAQTVYIYGATGFGKTELVRQFLGNKKHTVCSGHSPSLCIDDLPQMGDWNKKVPQTVVIDDIQFLEDQEQRRQVLTLVERDDIWLILIGRSPVPTWLIPLYVKQGMLVIGEEKLQMTVDEVQEYIAACGVPAQTESVLQAIQADSRGNIAIVRMLTQLLSEGRRYDKELIKEIDKLFARNLESSVMLQWDPELLEFLMQVSVVDAFDTALAELITGNRYVTALLEKAALMGNFLENRDGQYTLRPILLRALRHRAETVYGSERIREYAYNAGLYYETHDCICEALAMYEKSGSDDRIRALLIRNARRNPGNGHYYEMRKYYLALQPEVIEDSVVLMAGMSMLYSLLMMPKESEFWYEKLKSYEKMAKGGEKREAMNRLAYLDIALPHRGSVHVLEMIKRLPTLLFNKGISLSEMSVTSNIPSVMNGGKDFCEWSKQDRKLAASIGAMFERVFGRYGKGMLCAALAESEYEKGGDPCEVLSLLSRGQIETQAGGTMEIAFACIGMQVRLNLVHGQIQAAAELLDFFEEKVHERSEVQLLPNLNALRCRLALYKGDQDGVVQWLKQAPNEEAEFYLLERYRYLTKVRCYLFLGEYWKAHGLLVKLRYYAERYQRTYIAMECDLLLAITRFRLEENDWKERLCAVLQRASEYHFIRIVSEEGAAVWDLLERGRKEWLSSQVLDPGWFSLVTDETRTMAVRYPLYLKRQIAEKPRLGKRALTILQLQADGLSATEIAEQLSMKLETVRYHTKQNYRKLGVSGKADAVLTARSLGIL